MSMTKTEARAIVKAAVDHEVRVDYGLIDQDEYGYWCEIIPQELPHHFSTRAAAWIAAAEWVQARQGEIRQVEEEILWIESESSMSDGYPYPAALRIIARLKAVLADLQRGFKTVEVNDETMT